MTKHQEAPASSGGVAAKELAAIVERLERLDAEIAGLNDDKKDLYSETKSRGFDTRAIKAIISQRRQLEKNSAAYNETQSMIELYRAALGMSSQIDLFDAP
jgi:uncharacterized protein (UPF0335 family)